MGMFSDLFLAYVPQIGAPKSFRLFSASRADFPLHVLAMVSRQHGLCHIN